MAATDILDDTEALAAINSSDAGDHFPELARRVSAISQAIDAYCGPVVARTVTEVHDTDRASTLWLRQAPVLTITSVTEFDGTTQTVLTDESTFGTVGGSTGYVLDADRYSIGRRSGGLAYPFSTGQVQVVYQAGRFADTASVSARFKEAASDVLRRVWKREGSSWAYSPDFYANTDEGATVTASGFFRAVEPMIAEWLWDERRAPAIA